MKDINYFQIEFKEVETKGEIIKIKWYASTPSIDRYLDIVDPKAFSNSIIDYMKNPVVLLQHDWNRPVWKTIDYKLNFKGLEITAEISNNIDNLYNNINTWILKGFSIWYIPTKWEYIKDWDNEIRKITWLDLIEISIVSTPANKESLFTLAKSIKSFFNNLTNNNMENIEMIEEVKAIEEIKEEIKEELKEVKEDVIEEWINNTETLDGLEKSSESLDTQISDETKTIENIVEVKKEIVKEEDNKSEKELNILKEEIKELKENMLEIVEVLSKTIEKQTELKSIVNKIPVRKWLITYWESEVKSSLWKQIQDLRTQKFII